jgi:hypothetical protein
MTWGVAAPCFILWGLGIPAVIYWLMAKEERDLDTDETKIQFGFLYLGYKRDVYFWEIIIMYRKIIALMIAVLLSSTGVIVQASLLIAFLGVNSQVNSTMRPFITRQLNDTEDLSILAQLLTIYCGLFFEQIELEPDSTEDEKRIAEWTKMFLFAIIFVTNLIFLITWAINFCNAIREKVRETKWLYIILFLCCRPGKYEEDAINLA